MAILHDQSGAATTIASSEALTHWDATVAAVFEHRASAPAHLAETLAADPHFALGRAVKGIMLLTLARKELREAAEAEHAEALRLTASAPVTAREACWIEALGHWLADDPLTAARAIDRAIEHDPCDALAAKLSHAIRFMCGDRRGMLDGAQTHRSRYGMAKPFSGHIAGLLSFALEEEGDYAQAERIGRAALDLNPTDAWARHAVAHVMEMTGRAREGLAWLADGRRHRHGLNNFGGHLFWHEALFHLELGRCDAALDLYDSEVRRERTDDYRDIANAASLLQRLELAGVRVGGRWEELANSAARRVEDRCLVFADLHYALALAGAGRTPELLKLLEERPGSNGFNAGLRDRAGLALTRAIAAFQASDFRQAADELLRARPSMGSIGGSRAQRDIVEQMLIESLMRCGDLDQAERVSAARLAWRRGPNRVASSAAARIVVQRRQPALRLVGSVIDLMPSPALH